MLTATLSRNRLQDNTGNNFVDGFWSRWWSRRGPEIEVGHKTLRKASTIIIVVNIPDQPGGRQEVSSFSLRCTHDRFLSPLVHFGRAIFWAPVRTTTYWSWQLMIGCQLVVAVKLSLLTNEPWQVDFRAVGNFDPGYKRIDMWYRGNGRFEIEYMVKQVRPRHATRNLPAVYVMMLRAKDFSCE